jgi:hypothetical protein
MVDLHNKIKQKEAVDDRRYDMISFFRSSIIEYNEIHIKKAECIHELLP